MASRLPIAAEGGLPDLGDAAFCGLGEPLSAVYFVRANVLIRVHNLGPTPIDVGPWRWNWTGR